jgi:hypothetical protein
MTDRSAVVRFNANVSIDGGSKPALQELGYEAVNDVILTSI